MKFASVIAFISFLFLLATSFPIPPQSEFNPASVSLPLAYEDSFHPGTSSSSASHAENPSKASPYIEGIERTVTITIPAAFRDQYPKSKYEVKVKPKMTAEELEPIAAILSPAWAAAKANNYGELNNDMHKLEMQIRKCGVPIFLRNEITSDIPIGVMGGVVKIQTPRLPKFIKMVFGPQKIDIPPRLQKICGQEYLEFTSRENMTEEDLKPVMNILLQVWNAARETGDRALCDVINNFETRLKRRGVPLGPRRPVKGSKPKPPGAAKVIRPPRLRSRKIRKHNTRRKEAAKSPATKSLSVVQHAQPLAFPLNTVPLGITPSLESDTAAHWPDGSAPMVPHTQSGNIGHEQPANPRAHERTDSNLGLAVPHTDSSGAPTQSGGLAPSRSSLSIADLINRDTDESLP